VLGSQQAQVALAEADVVVAATSARAPFFDSRLLRPDVVVAAVGSHEPQARELDDYLMARASVVVEDVATAMREAGDVVLAVQSGALHLDQLVPFPRSFAARSTCPRTDPSS
jgi:ornithine cyclodeaminase